MAAPQFSAQDYLQALQALLPRGHVWPRDADATQTKLVAALARVYERTNLRADQLLSDAFPATTFELLPEWEETLGLPDPCAGPAPTVGARRAQVVARVKAQGGQSVAYLTAFAASLGYTITITQYVPARAGLLKAGQPLNGPDWAHAWSVTAPGNTVTHAQAGTLAAGEPLAYWGNTVLGCELAEVKPAHSTLFFNYT